MLVSDLYCPSCRNAKDHKSQDNEICWSCVAMGGAGNYKQSKTHGDQLRAMADDELAEKIGGSIDCEVCKTMHHSESGECPCRPHQSCVDFWLDWLKQEASK